MSIQFNKVTWYSKLGAIIVAVAAVFLALYVNAQYQEFVLIRETVSSSSASGVVSSTGDVALAVNKSVTFDGLKITFDKIVQDNRCPVEVECLVAGHAITQVTLSSLGKVGEANLVSDNIPYRFGNYAIYFKHVSPVRHSKTEIDPKNYIIVLHVINVLNS